MEPIQGRSSLKLSRLDSFRIGFGRIRFGYRPGHPKSLPGRPVPGVRLTDPIETLWREWHLELPSPFVEGNTAKPWRKHNVGVMRQGPAAFALGIESNHELSDLRCRRGREKHPN